MPKRCPAPINVFKGRKDILELLHQCFPPSLTSVESGKQRIFVLYGLGGGGKTQIALKFVKECQNETQPQRCALSVLTGGSHVRVECPCATSFSEVFFVDASTDETITLDLKNIASQKKIGNKWDDAITWLAGERNDWLLLFDSADDPNLNLSKFFPSCDHGNILITSRNREIRIHAPRSNCKVGEMTPEHARHLLFEIIDEVITNETVIQADAIVKVLVY